MTKNYALIGYPLGHSKSKIIHQEIARQCGMDITYDLIEISPDRLNSSIDDLKKLNGFSVTIPHKQSIIPFLDAMDDKAEMYMSVNTVKCDEAGKLYGYNTDCIGVVRAFEAQNVQLNGKVLLLGAGGVARTFAFECAKRNCDITFAVLNNDVIKAESIKAEVLQKVSPDIKINICDINTVSGQYDILMNGTPVGMYPNIDACPVNDNVIAGCAVAFDAVYNPRKTQLLQKAEANGSKIVEGMPMLIYQAVAQQEIWQGKQLTVDYNIIAELVNR